MIVIYPMLTSTGVSQAVIPGVCKVVERYLLLYRMQDILRTLNVAGMFPVEFDINPRGIIHAADSAGRMRDQGFGESEILEANEYGTDKQGNPIDPDKDFDKIENERKRNEIIKGETKNANKEEELKRKEHDLRQKERDLQDSPYPGQGKIRIGQSQGPQIEMANMATIALEPTWCKIQSRVPGTMILGVKVIPYPIKAEHGLAGMIQNEAKLKSIDRFLLSTSRKTMRLFWSLCKTLRLPKFSKRAITGDPEQDILWGASRFSYKDVFLLLNYIDMTDDDFFSSAQGIQNLHSLGWNSFGVADDINKRMIFCMKELKGLCSTIPYAFLFSSLSKDHLKVYEDLSDIRKSASPLFKQTKTASGIFV